MTDKNAECAIDWASFQREVGEWAEDNFGSDQPHWFCSKGMYEEYGELIHSDLKRDQGIRLDEDDVGEAAERDAVGDIIIYCCDYLYRCPHDVTIPEALEEHGHHWTPHDDKDEALRSVGGALCGFDSEQPDEDQIKVNLSYLFHALQSFCEHKGYDFSQCVSDAWHGEVSQREWDADVSGVA